jgi:hypothetical protein
MSLPSFHQIERSELGARLRKQSNVEAGKDRYVNTRSHEDRVKTLREMERAGETLDAFLVDDLLCLGLPDAEKRLLMRVCDGSDAAVYEDFLTRNLLHWDSNIAAYAVQLWVKYESHQLWPRFLFLVQDPGVPQRLVYQLLDHVQVCGGRPLLQAVLASAPYMDFSDKSQALLLHRLVQWGVEDEKVTHLAEKIAVKTFDGPFPSSLSLPFAIEYLACFQPQQLNNLLSNPIGHKAWGEVIKPFIMGINSFEALKDKLLTYLKKPDAKDEDFYTRLIDLWLPTWNRNRIDAKTLTPLVKQIVKRKYPQDMVTPPCPSLTWEFFAGISQDVLQETAAGLSKGDRSKFASILGRLLDESVAYDQLQSKFLKTHKIKRPHDSLTATADVDKSGRKRLFDLLYREGAKSKVVGEKTIWHEMAESIEKPTKVAMLKVCKNGSSIEGVFLPAFFQVLERFEGFDGALPILSNYLHTKERVEQNALLLALDGINTPNANAILVRYLGDPNLDDTLKLEISYILAGKSLDKFQTELRHVVGELSNQIHSMSRKKIQLLDSLRSLLVAEPVITQAQNVSANETAALDQKELDKLVAAKIPSYSQLPSETMRALRTAILILDTIKSRSSLEGVDVSPAVDMQYKALEILFRSKFEDATLKLVQSGMLYRKLDYIGYVRPHKIAIEEFENHISSLPIIRDIPVFSRYKLNKIMRAIAMYRPGKRFGLDGLKAFGIFFLVFGRKNCRYRLAELLPLAMDDEELFAFCRDLHLFQDIRNRAVHEGLPIQALGDVEALWSMTASIIERALKLVDKKA